MSTLIIPSIANLKRAIEIAEKLEALRAELGNLFTSNSSPAASAPAVATPTRGAKRGGKRSPEVRARMAASQKARWAKAKGETVPTAETPKPATKAKGKRGLTPEGRAKLAAAMKARWAARAKGAPALNAPKKAGKPAKAAPAAKGGRKAKRSVSPEAREKMAAAAKLRWAKAKKA